MIKSKKQKLMIEYLLSSPDTYIICKTILKAEYFNPEYRQSVNFIHNYHDNYNAIPSLDLIQAETDMKFDVRQVTKDEIEYCSTEIEKFCRQRGCEQAVEKASLLLNKDQPDMIESIIKDAVSISLNKDVGSDYFQNVRSRLERLSKEPQRISTGWSGVDDLLGGGLARSELILWSANSGGGKSITLANLAINMVMQKLNVLYITLELSTDMVEQRFDSMFTGVPTVNWLPNMDKIINEVSEIGEDFGKLIVHRMQTGTTANAIRGFLKEFELKNGYIPDLLIVDYLDAMGANEHVSADNIHEKDKRATEQLRDILIDYSMMGATASQQNRCLALNTVVELIGGVFKQIKDVIVGDKLFNGTTYNSVTEVLPTTKQKTYKITTKSGKEIICSGNHKFLTTDNQLGTIFDGTIKQCTKLFIKR